MKRRRRDDDDDVPDEPSSASSLRWPIIIGALTLLLIIGGIVVLLVLSGETHQQVFDRFRDRFADRRQQFQVIAGKVPPVGSVRKNEGRGNLDPRPIYDPSSKTFNKSVVMAEQLRDPDVQLQTPQQFDLNLFEGLLLMTMQWTGPRSPMAESVRGQRARANLVAELEGTLAQSYLVVLRPVRYDRPVVFEGKGFIGGNVDLEGFLVDLRNTDIVGTVRVAGQADDMVRGIKGNMDAAVFSSMWKNVRGKLARSLGEVSGGTFVFN
ncbi:MAG: hypothetical protein FJ271_21450 [Planctomycetes bacterium]|nr:hypothetical protein [Planctomycetota bacterium]